MTMQNSKLTPSVMPSGTKDLSTCLRKSLAFAGDSSGFTLMGVIFATAMIIIVLVAVLSLLYYVIAAGRLSADKFVAANLAQEGIEIVRAIRDSNWKAGDPWNDGFPTVAGSYNYQVQYDSTELADYTAQPLKINNNGYYQYSSGQNTKFTRRIILRPDIDASYPGDNIGVISEVTWSSAWGTYSTVVEDRLYNWW